MYRYYRYYGVGIDIIDTLYCLCQLPGECVVTSGDPGHGYNATVPSLQERRGDAVSSSDAV